MVPNQGRGLPWERRNNKWKCLQARSCKTLASIDDASMTHGFPMQNFATGGTILTGIYGNDSTVTFHGIKGTGKPQWVSFYYQSQLILASWWVMNMH